MSKIFKVVKITGIVIGVIIVCAVLFVGIYSQIGTSKVKTDIEGMGTKLIVFVCQSADRTESHWKFGFCINDKINMRVSVEKTCEARIKTIGKRTTFRSKRITFFIDPNGEIEIEGKSNKLAIDYQIQKGNKLSLQFAELRKVMLPGYEEESKLWLLGEKLRETDMKESRRLDAQFDSVRFYVVAPLRTEWAKQHLNYELTPLYFLESHIPEDTVIKYNNLLSSNAKESEFGRILSKKVIGLVNTKTGNNAPKFSQRTFSGTDFSLNQMKGKYVVLDFWGSWCGPCMQGVPKMKEYYKKYKNQVEFVGIACEDKESDWKKAIETNQMNWTQILNDKLNNDIATLYDISGYPTKIIINQKGEIVSKYTGEGIDFYNKVDSIMMK